MTGVQTVCSSDLDLLAVQGTLKSLLQHHSSNASILRCSAFFIVQLDVCSCHLLFDHFQCTLIHGPDILGSYAILLFTALDLFHAKMGWIKDRNGMDITEAEDIKRWQEYTEKLYKKKIFMAKIIMMV